MNPPGPRPGGFAVTMSVEASLSESWSPSSLPASLSTSVIAQDAREAQKVARIAATSTATVTLGQLMAVGQNSDTAVLNGSLMAALPAVIGNVDGSVLTPLLRSMGLEIGGADVTALKDFLNCGVPTLVS